MITTSGNPHPFCVAWEQYLKDRDKERLLATAPVPADKPSGHQFLLWMSIGVGDWELASRLEARQVSLWDCDEGPGLIYQAVEDFGDSLSIDAVKWLVDHGALIDDHRRNANDWTALHLACRSGYLGAVSALVINGADLNLPTGIDGGWTPLMEACAAGSKAVVEFLLEHGADPGVTNSYEAGKARDIAAKKGNPEIAALLDSWTNSRPRRVREAWKLKRKERRKKPRR
jgi:hypothetical protein